MCVSAGENFLNAKHWVTVRIRVRVNIGEEKHDAVSIFHFDMRLDCHLR